MASVIKAGATGPILKRLSTVDLADHLSEARVVVESAKGRGADIVAQAEARADEVLERSKKSGHETGYRLGYEEGKEAGRRAAFDEARERFQREQATIVADMARAIREIDDTKEKLRIEAERNLLEFAVRIATRLTFAVGRLHRDAARENLKRAIRLVQSKTDLTIRVHPSDLDSIRTFAGSVLRDVDASQAVTIEADKAIAPGGCKVESEPTRVDATLETQVDEIVSLLLGAPASDA